MTSVGEAVKPLDFEYIDIPTAACPDAELYLAFTLDAMAKMKDDGRVLNKYRVGMMKSGGGSQIVCDGKIPLMIRKHVGEPTAITTAPLTIAGKNISIGSILGIDLSRGSSMTQYPPEFAIEIVPHQRVEGLKEMRRSYFADDPEGRLENPDFTAPKIPERIMTIYRTMTMAGMTELARQTLLKLDRS